MTINEMLEKIKNNLFVNDMNWQDRAKDNSLLAHLIRLKYPLEN